jgi:uncharacterized protein
MAEHRELRVLSRAESLDLLASATVGRVVLTSNALPAALPVTYAVDGATVVFRSGPGIKLDAAERGTVVAFEADHFVDELRMGWSVLVVGVARLLTSPADVARAEALDIPAWTEPVSGGYVRVEIGSVSGRFLAPVRAGVAATG